VLKLDKAWWPGNTCSENEIKGKIYYVTGDISPSLLKSMNVVFVNKKLANELGRNENNSLIELVKNGHWTIDEMINISKDVYRDLDSVEGKSNGDTYGIALNAEDAANACWTGMGYKYYDRSIEDDELYRLSDNFISASPFVTKMSDWWNTSDVYVYNEAFSNLGETAVNAFSRSGALLLCCQLGRFDPSLCNDDYTVLPAPKLSRSQIEYHTSVGNKFSLYSICSEYNNIELAAQVLQTMGFYGYHLTTSVIVEETFGGKDNMNADDRELFETVRSSITLDSGRILELYSGAKLSNNLYHAISNTMLWSAVVSPQKAAALKHYVISAGENILDYADEQ